MIDSTQTDAEGQVDVAARYRFFFLSAFYISVTQVLIGLLALFSGENAGDGCRSMLVNAYKLTWILITIDWVLVALFRFQESGKQCSGDYMANRNDAQKFQYV